MFHEIRGDKKVCIKIKIHNSIFNLLIFSNIFGCCHVVWCLKFVSFISNITDDDKNSDG